MHPVAAVHIEAARGTEQHRVARGRPAERMGRWVRPGTAGVRSVRLHLDDPHGDGFDGQRRREDRRGGGVRIGPRRSLAGPSGPFVPRADRAQLGVVRSRGQPLCVPQLRDAHLPQCDVRTRWSCRRGADPVRGGNRRRGCRLGQKARRPQTARPGARTGQSGQRTWYHLGRLRLSPFRPWLAGPAQARACGDVGQRSARRSEHRARPSVAVVAAGIGGRVHLPSKPACKAPSACPKIVGPLTTSAVNRPWPTHYTAA